MTATTTNDGSRNARRAAAEAELFNRLIASAAGLPRVCALKKCRRRKRCLGNYGSPDLPCLRHHRGLARARYESALRKLGWDGSAPSAIAGKEAS